jgi:hypothetical protein
MIRRKVWNWEMKCGRILEDRNGGVEVDEKDGKWAGEARKALCIAVNRWYTVLWVEENDLLRRSSEWETGFLKWEL